MPPPRPPALALALASDGRPPVRQESIISPSLHLSIYQFIDDIYNSRPNNILPLTLPRSSPFFRHYRCSPIRLHADSVICHLSRFTSAVRWSSSTHLPTYPPTHPLTMPRGNGSGTVPSGPSLDMEGCQLNQREKGDESGDGRPSLGGRDRRHPCISFPNPNLIDVTQDSSHVIRHVLYPKFPNVPDYRLGILYKVARWQGGRSPRSYLLLFILYSSEE